MSKYEYAIAQSIDDAVRLLNEPGKRSIALAGGTDVFVELRVNPLWFDQLVDVKRIPEMRQIHEDAGVVTIGAAVNYTQAAESPILQKRVPFLLAACNSIGGPAIRNCGTFGGNVANAAACADSLPPMVCLEAVAHLRSGKGGRSVRVEELVTGPHKTQIESGELLTHFTFAVPPQNAHGCFIKIGRRKAQSISRLSIAVLGGLDMDGGIEFVRMCPGAAVATPVRFRNIEQMLIGQRPNEELFAAAGERLVAEMIESTGQRWSTPYKEVALKAIAERALANIFLQDGSSC